MIKFNISFLVSLISFFVVSAASAHVILDYPVGGETLVAGEKMNIRWHIQIPHDQENWDLYFSEDGGANWQAIQLDLETSELNYEWTIPQIMTEQARIRIIMDNTGQDYTDTSGDFTIQGVNALIRTNTDDPTTYALFANYPNPFNPVTFIRYQLPVAQAVKLIIYDQAGKMIRILIDKEQSAGIYRVRWDGRNQQDQSVSSGIYFYRLEAGTFTQVRRMVLLK